MVMEIGVPVLDREARVWSRVGFGGDWRCVMVPSTGIGAAVAMALHPCLEAPCHGFAEPTDSWGVAGLRESGGGSPRDLVSQSLSSRRHRTCVRAEPVLRALRHLPLLLGREFVQVVTLSQALVPSCVSPMKRAGQTLKMCLQNIAEFHKCLFRILRTGPGLLQCQSIWVT